jgi:hypothetical protein
MVLILISNEENFKGSKVWWHYATLFEIYYFLTFIHTIQSHSVHPSPFAEARLLETSSRLRSATGASMGCRDEIRTRACLTASRRTTNWAAPHPNWSAPHPNEENLSLVT